MFSCVLLLFFLSSPLSPALPCPATHTQHTTHHRMYGLEIDENFGFGFLLDCVVFVRVAGTACDEYMLGDRAGLSGKANDLRNRKPCCSRLVLKLKMCKILSILPVSFSRKTWAIHDKQKMAMKSEPNIRSRWSRNFHVFACFLDENEEVNSVSPDWTSVSPDGTSCFHGLGPFRKPNTPIPKRHSVL